MRVSVDSWPSRHPFRERSRRWRAACVHLVLAALALVALTPAAASATGVGVVSPRQGQLDVFARGSGGHLLWSEWTAGNGWSRWINLGGSLHPDTEIAAVSRSADYISVYVRWSDNRLMQKPFSANAATRGAGWGPWQDLGGQLTGGPGAVAVSSTREETFHRGSDGAIYQKGWYETGGWSGFGRLGESLKAGTGPTESSRQAGYFDVSFVGTNGEMYIKSFRPNPDTWFPAYSKGGNAQSSIGMASMPGGGWLNGRQDYLHLGTSGHVHQMTYENGGFIGFVDLGAPGEGIAANSTPSTIWWTDANGQIRQDIFLVGADGNIKQRTWQPSTGWLPWMTGLPVESDQNHFLGGRSCAAAPSWAAGSMVGLSLGLDTPKVVNSQLATFDRVISCLAGVTAGRAKIGLRMQLRYDSGVPDGNNSPQVEAFRQLLARVPNAQPIVSVMSVDFTQCDGVNGRPLPTQVGLVQAKQASCSYPTSAAYLGYFNRLVDQVQRQLGRTDVLFTAWNEPDHVMFTLRYVGAKTRENAASIAGGYWKQAVTKVPASRLLAGEFASDQGGTAKSAFQTAAGQVPSTWAYHPYDDMTATGGTTFGRTSSFQTLIGGAALWLTEIGVKASTNPDGYASFTRGADLKAQLGSTATRAMLYDLQSTGSAVAHDSSLTDQIGRARPVVCGLASLPIAYCAGTTTNGGAFWNWP